MELIGSEMDFKGGILAKRIELSDLLPNVKLIEFRLRTPNHAVFDPRSTDVTCFVGVEQWFRKSSDVELLLRSE